MAHAQRQTPTPIQDYESATIVSDLMQIADYITHMREEIAALRRTR